jgi:hypothetical protein
MSVLTELLAGAGSWAGTSTLQDPHTSGPDASRSTAEVVPLLGDRFARIDYTWSYRGAPHAGSLLLGYDAEAGEVSACWIDSWHLNRAIMLLHGREQGDSKLDVLGSYPPGDGSPDWGWRIAVTPKSREGLRIVMHNIDPEGREYLAVDASYVPVVASIRALATNG